MRDSDGEIVALAPGTVFHGTYEVVKCIKAGGMGAVYEVLHQSTQRYRALKVMLPSLVSDPEARARFELEAKIAAGIESEHIVETMDAGVDEATRMPFIVMELLKGEELGKLLRERRRVSPDDVVTYLHQAALALDRVHAAGIIHRDLKPENLFLTFRDDGSPRVKILDFGVAKIVAEGGVNANTTMTVGSPVYMGPEQVSGELKIGPPVDRYSLAQIAFTLLVGKPYWHVERKAAKGVFEFMLLLVKGAKVPASERARAYGVSLPAAFDPWFVKATAVDPSKRHESAVAMMAELAKVFEVAVPVAPTMPPPRMPLPSAITLPPPEPVGTGAATAAQSEPAKADKDKKAEKDKEDTPAGEQSSTGDRPALVGVRTDEPSLQPVSVPRPSRAWVVPVALLVVGALGVVGALLFWPQLSARIPQRFFGPVRTPVSESPSAGPVIPSVAASENPQKVAEPVTSSLPSALPVDAASAMPSAAVSAVPSASASSTATTPAASASARGAASSKPFRPTKGKNVLDVY